ncbi:acyl-CoA dehydrogenase family protein [Rhodovulum sp. DZ06]|uniref:acyl-CoA dehydrogenase family protein n=1 Tax=Rhodovulum sp. DZ06 TaxID=3425126 RepID=UPI003D34E9A2
MTPLRPRAELATHDVSNQPEPRDALALWDGDAPLRAAVARTAPRAAAPLAAAAATFGAPDFREAARDAERNPPELRPFDRAGRRIDEVAFHPGYHKVMAEGARHGFSAGAWAGADSPLPRGHAAHAAMVYLLSQVEPGACCPLTMTSAAIPPLRAGGAAFETWTKGAMSGVYDPASRPAPEKAGLTIGMAMTEKQGGSDVRANATLAEPDGDDAAILTGHKWFCSAPMCDGFLTLAQEEAGLSCFLVPRWTPDGARNRIEIQRLKDKLGNKANASSEIEYRGAWAQRLGAPGRGIPTIIEMVHHTRLDAAMAPVGLTRRALDEAAWWARGRSAFQKRLIDQPLMESVLGDLALDWIGALALVMRVGQAFDGSSEEDRAFARIAVAIAKYWGNKRAPLAIVEAMECLGGMGYVEDTPMPMLYREAPLNGIWEGSGNVICLDILRALGRDRLAGEVLLAEIAGARGRDARYDAAFEDLAARLVAPPEREARMLAERMAILLQASLLMRFPVVEEGAGAGAGAEGVADAFIATRVAGDWGRSFGTLPQGVDAGALAALI